MSTRSEIAIQMKDSEEVKSIYCHSDGYIEHNGIILNDHYNSYDLALSIINQNDCSFLGETIGESRFYNSWRDEGTKHKTFLNEWDFMQTFNHDIFAEYLYLFKNNEWFVSELKSLETPKDSYNDYICYHTKYIPVSTALAKLRVQTAQEELELQFA